ncbi:hypothetical protein [Saccharopolyspora mangrovi]|uniref:Uncharacterized protein n=1 Tax=Saccharopolyspora mangrovi TaxID=3082379 RepID=A0ABU6A7U5_9PSEU|nr:hypothetical protein [Saccharopolyspora sp. S2-29]MEB3367561.1 hypothetical protein [Saccharopolyspora sp. S2-29]
MRAWRRIAEARRSADNPDERPGLLGGLLGRGKANDDQVEPVETWWQVQQSSIAEYTSAARGRGFEPVEFFRINFADGSALEFRLKDAADLVGITEQRI